MQLRNCAEVGIMSVFEFGVTKHFFIGEDSELVVKCSVLILKTIKVLFVMLEMIDFVLEVGDDDVLLVAFHTDGRVEVGGARLGTAHLILNLLRPLGLINFAICLYSIVSQPIMDFFSFQNKKVPRELSSETRELIELLGETRNKQIESQIILKEISAVKQLLNGKCPPEQYPDILVKLIYFVTLGYDTSFAHILPINLCQTEDLFLKKMAYLLAAMLVKPGAELGLLMSNTLLKDLQGQNQFVLMIGLTMMRYFLTPELIPHVLPLLYKLLKHGTSVIRKKAYLVFLNIYQKHPLFLIDTMDIHLLTTHALNDSDPVVAFTGVSMLSRVVPGNNQAYKGMIPRLADLLTMLTSHKLPREFDYHRMPSPWYQIYILQLLAELCHNDQAASASVYESLQRTMKSSCTGALTLAFAKGILQQCIKTICAIYPNRNLLDRSLLSVSLFFEKNSNNMRYFGVCCLIELAKANKQCLDRWQLVLLDCLESPDMTLAEKTVGLLVQVANVDNAGFVLDKVMGLAERTTDDTEKRSLIRKSINLIESFSQDRELFLRRMNEVFFKFETFISDASLNNFLRVLQEIAENEPDFLDLAVAAYVEIITNFRNSVLVKVSSWVIGEFTHAIYQRDKDTGIVDRSVRALLDCAQEYAANSEATFLLASSLMKLAGKEMTTLHQPIKEFLLELEGHRNFFVHKIGEEFLRMARYGSTLHHSNDVNFDANVPFLTNYLDAHCQQQPRPTDKAFLISKSQSFKANQYELVSQELDLPSADCDLAPSNLFEFKPAARWTKETQDISVKAAHPEKQVQKKEFTLRGPHEGKRQSNKIEDQKKMQLAKSLFGKKR